MPSTPDPNAPPGTPGSSGTNTVSATMTLSKVFGYCTKLNKNNYDVWLAGLISAITGLTLISTFYEQLEKVLRYLKTHAYMELDAITSWIGTNILSLRTGATDRTRGDFLHFNTQLFHVFNMTIDETLSNFKRTLAGNSYFEDGLKVIRYIYDHLGPGDRTSRTGITLNIMNLNLLSNQSERTALPPMHCL